MASGVLKTAEESSVDVRYLELDQSLFMDDRLFCQDPFEFESSDYSALVNGPLA